MTNGKAVPTESEGNPTFLVCAWNDRKPDDKINKTLENEQLAESVALFLKAFGWREVKVKEEKEASLVVLLPRLQDSPLSIQEAAIFRYCLPGRSKHVLLVERPGIRNIKLPEGVAPDWLSILRIESCMCFHEINFEEWLKQTAKSKEKNGYPLSKGAISRLIGCMISNDVTKQSSRRWMQHNKLLSASGSKLINPRNSIVEQLWGVLRQSSRYDRLEHDLNRTGSDMHSSDEATAQNRRKKLLLDTYMDLRTTLAARQRLLDMINRRDRKGAPIVILLVDDNPKEIVWRIHGIMTTLLPWRRKSPCFELLVWNPCDPKVEGSLDVLLALERYDSLSGDSSILEKISLNKYDVEDKKLKPSDVKFNLAKTDYILVDLLMDDRTSSRDCGTELIRGLSRLKRDIPDQCPDGRHEIIALSRADDPRKIQTALSAGATGYIPKSRLLSLPAVLAEHHNPVSEQVAQLHRNFRLLYSLPNETIRLLHTVKVRKDADDTGGKQSCKPSIEGPPVGNDGSTPPRRVPLECLIDAIPKTDLHVHVGSCMQPEFLIVASAVMLSRVFAPARKDQEKKRLNLVIRKLVSAWTKGSALDTQIPGVRGIAYDSSIPNPVEKLAKELKEKINPIDPKKTRPKGSKDEERGVRSAWHRRLGVSDSISEKEAIEKIEKKLNVDLFLFAMGQHIGWELSKAHILRLFILHCGAQDGLCVQYNGNDLNLTAINTAEVLAELGCVFWHRDGMQIVPHIVPLGIKPLPAQHEPSSAKSLLRRLLESGTESHNLSEYLEGCEFAGAEHLQHTWLMKLYAQQVVVEFIRYGVMYAELRGSPDGYEHMKSGFDFNTACTSFIEAIEQAQKIAADLHANRSLANFDGWIAGLLGQRWALRELRRLYDGFLNDGATIRFPGFPVKIGLIFVGKRHKPAFEMIREAAAVVMHRAQCPDPSTSASAFAKKYFRSCQVVGFDLAGNEPDFPPSLFGDEYERLSKMHIPITVHAGENASAQFIADAVLELGAQRIGHGLSVCDNPQLMDRLREQGICIELCPVSNHQTCSFVKGGGREYPLKTLLKNGNPVCLNTDNPIVSDTNITKECFKAAAACEKEGLSIWELLRIVRMGFAHSFMTMPERRAILEIADQILYDLFSRKDVLAMLHLIHCNQERAEGGS